MKVHRDPQSAPFFDAAARGELLIRRCTGCDRRHAPQAVTCRHCGSTALDWVRAAGTGRLQTWMVAHARAAAPVTVGIVELDEGPWLQARVVDAGDLRVDLPVRVGFEPVDGGEPLPVLRPE